MFKPSKLLKVVSIIMIILGVFSLIGSIAGFVMLKNPQMMEVLKSTGVEVTAFDYVLSLIVSFLDIAAGIFGLKGKSAKLCYILEGSAVGLNVISLIMSAMKMGFQWYSFTSFIVPALYLWGVYQSQE